MRMSDQDAASSAKFIVFLVVAGVAIGFIFGTQV